jgi:hypothetical protein
MNLVSFVVGNPASARLAIIQQQRNEWRRRIGESAFGCLRREKEFAGTSANTKDIISGRDYIRSNLSPDFE